MTPPRLSICIPTYNFGAFLRDTLRAVAGQLTDEVEVVVLDGGSTDDTPEVVAGFAREIPRLVAVRLERPGGIDGDLARTVALASGEYCWLLSSDDLPAPGAVARILEELRTGADVYLLDRIECDVDMRPIRRGEWLAREGSPEFRLAEPAELARYLGAARSIGALFSYMSSVVVRRAAWDAAEPPPRVNGTNYAHVARLFRGLLGGGVLRHVRAPLVLCRGENDSFARGGVVRRFLIDLDGYLTLADVLLRETAARSSFLRIMRLEHPWYVYAEIRSRASAQQWRGIRENLRAFGYAPWQVAVVGAAGRSGAIMALLRFAWFGARRLHRLLFVRGA